MVVAGGGVVLVLVLPAVASDAPAAAVSPPVTMQLAC